MRKTVNISGQTASWGRGENGRWKSSHGISKTPTGRSWYCMMQRCFNPNATLYGDWGGRGIKPCLFLSESPLNLISVLGERPSLSVSLDRINNDLGYWCGSCPECVNNKRAINIRWATRMQQGKNSRRAYRLTIGGATDSFRGWIRRSGLTPHHFYRRFLISFIATAIHLRHSTSAVASPALPSPRV